jgi:AcrR family transcriptional regulator
MDSKRDTKKDILDLAEKLIKTRGYHGFSYKDIAGTLQVKNAAIHYHFPQKENLGTEVLEREIRRFTRWKEKQEMEKLTFPVRLENFILIYENQVKDQHSACLVGASASVYPVLPDPIKERASQLANQMLDYLQYLLEEGRTRGELHFNGNPADKARLIASALAGGLQLTRLEGRQFFQSVKDQLMNELTTTSNN